jgi:uncharacterized protein YgbK (DUF1537 family)
LQRWILAIADDLTGALEVGAQFAGRGFASLVVTRPDVVAMDDFSVLVIDTETRHLPPSEAYEVVSKTATCWRQQKPGLVYKKTDSTLRGNIAAEFRALLDVFPERSLIYAPAYPAMGRTVRDGQLYVGGEPAHRTVFGKDPMDPVRTNDIRMLMEGIPVKVMDGEIDADITAAAQGIAEGAERLLAAGPAALAAALADQIRVPRSSVKLFPRISRCLVVNGSLHPASAAQVAFAKSRGCFDRGWRLFDDDPGGAGPERAVLVGKRVSDLLSAVPGEALIVFGGDTAYGIHRALGAQPFEPHSEILPGVPLSRSAGLYWITKAGGFGEIDALCEIQRRLA